MGRAGDGEEGIIPRLCQDLFEKIGNDDDPDVQYSVEVTKEITYRINSNSALSQKHLMLMFTSFSFLLTYY